MKLTTTLGRGLAAIGTIGALGLGSLILAAPAGAAEIDPHAPDTYGVVYVQPGETITTYPVLKPIGSMTVQPGMSSYVFAEGPGARVINGAPFPGFVKAGQNWNRVIGLNIGQCGEWNTSMQRFDCKATTSSNYTASSAETYHWEVKLVIPADAQPGAEYRTSARINNASFTGYSDTYVVAEPLVEVADLVVTSPADQSTIDTSDVRFEGTAEPGETVVITDAAGNELASASVDAQGNWSVTVSGPLADGPLDLTFTAGEKSVTNSYVVVAEEEGNGVPVMAPLAAGAGLLALAGVGAYGLRRRGAGKA